MSCADATYFDYAASAPPYPDALDVFTSVSQSLYGNPSSQHEAGRDAHRQFLTSKEAFCNLLNFPDGRLLLTSSASEANTTIIEGHIKRQDDAKILIAEDVHDSVWYAQTLHDQKSQTWNIDSAGRLDLEQLSSELRSGGYTLCCFSHASNETGIIQPAADIIRVCHAHDVAVLMDAVQTIGHIPVDLTQLNADYVTFSAHKFAGPRGAGGILMRDDRFAPLIHGGRQEWQHRAGTENIAALAAATRALEISLTDLDQSAKCLIALQTIARETLRSVIPGLLINTDEPSLPGFLSCSIASHPGSEIVSAASLKGFAISTGSACHANQQEGSRIISAMGRSSDEALGSFRISMGRTNTEQSVIELCNCVSSYLT